MQLISTTFMYWPSLKKPHQHLTPKSAAQPKESLADGTEGWGCLTKGISEGPHIFPALWCPFAFGARCQPPVPEGDAGARWFLSRLRWERAQPTLPRSPVSLVHRVHFVHMLIFFILFLFPFPPPHLPPCPVFLSLIPLVFFGENT